MLRTRSTLPALLAALVLAGCYGLLDEQPDTIRPLDPSMASLPATDIFEMAAQDWDVPRDLLVAIAWHESSFAPEAHAHEDESHRHRPALGWMGLTPERIALAAELTGYPAETIEHNREASILAGAAVLSTLRDSGASFASGDRLDANWWPVVVAWSELGQEWMDHEFAWDVFRTLQNGLAVPTESGDLITMDGVEVPGLEGVDFVRAPASDSGSFAAAHGYPGAARWVPAHSSNQSSRSSGTSSINRVVLHTTEGSYNGAISWFQNSSSDVSSHYVLRKSDGEITQMVSDERKAWHACSNNNDTIGLEHEGASSSASTWTPQLLESSARLTAWLVTTYDIPIDRDHIVGHGEIQPSSCSYRYDPGPHFPWDQYMSMVASYATGSSPDPIDPGDPGDPGGPAPVDPAPPTPAPASVSFQSPRNGDVVGNPVTMRVVQNGAHHVEIWAGPYRLAHGLVANPVHYGRVFEVIGSRTLTAKAFSASGVVLATDTITIDIQSVSGTLAPQADKISGMTWKLTADHSGSQPHAVRYWIDGFALADEGSAQLVMVGAPYAMHYTFNQPATGRLLQARGYDHDGRLVSEGFTYIDIELDGSGGSILATDAQGAGGTIMRLVTQATTDVGWVEYRVDGILLHDMVTGSTKAEPDDYDLWYQFEVSGARTMEVRAYDLAGDLIDVDTSTIYVPSPELKVAWTRTGGMHYIFDAEAPAGTVQVVIEIDEWALPDIHSGDQWTEGPDFVLEYHFNYAGYRALHAEAIDPVGNVLGEYDAMIQVY
jgi:hypothetical protein